MNERDVIVKYFIERLGIPAEQAARIPEDAVQRMTSDPRLAIIDLCALMGRESLKKGKIPYHATQLKLALRTALENPTPTRSPSVALHAAMASSRPASGTEARVDTLIEKLEDGFGAFEEKIQDKAASVGWPSDQWTQDHFNAPFEVMRMNGQNPHKNFPRRNAQGVTNLGNNHNFAFDIAPQQTGMVAAFSPMTRSLQVAESIDPQNDLDMLILYHELKHAALDGNKRNAINSQQQWNAYQAFYTGRSNERPRIDLSEELYTYGYEIEGLNLLLDDKVRTNTAPNMRSIRETLNARKDQEPTIDMLMEFAKDFYPQRIQPNQAFPQPYVNTIGKTLVQAGYDTYLMHPHTLQVQPYRVSGT